MTNLHALIRLFSVTITALLVCIGIAGGSDHADPIDPLNRQRQEGGITDLFVFPVLKDQSPAFPYAGNATVPISGSMADLARTPMTTAQQAEIDSIVVVLCVRRALTDSGTLTLEPYTYRVHIDTNSAVTFAQNDDPIATGADAGEAGYGGHAHAPSGRPTPHEAFLRYGGLIEHPDKISEDIVLEFELTGKAIFKAGFPKYLNRKGVPLQGWDIAGIQTASGVFDDPFIFPAFFGTNIVGMAVRIPMSAFGTEPPTDLLIWATSHEGSRQIDHQGRSLRTQNPRFELLNELHPGKHVSTILEEHEHPGLLRDIALRLNFAQTFAYRKWDFVPDVMVYTTRYPVGFPNGRLLTDDVAARLAQWGDTLLFELSYQHNKGNWPRQMTNDQGGGVFKDKFPYLLDPQPEKAQAPPPGLSMASIWKLIGIAVGLVVVLILENWLVAIWYCRRKRRKVLL